MALVSDDLSPDAIQNLLHELQVHQIELELQNEELHRVQDELQAARMKYTYLYDFAPVGYFTMDQSGVIEEVNLAGAALLGMDRQHLVHRSFSDMVYPEDQDIYYLNLRRFFGSPSSFGGDLRMVKADGMHFDAHLIGLVIQNDESQKPQCLMTVTDITKRKRDEQEALLRATTQERERLARDLHDAVTQTLFAASLLAESLPRLWTHSPVLAQERLTMLHQMIRGALAEMRLLLLDLRPAALSETDMLTLLSHLTTSIQGRTRLNVSLHIQPNINVPPEVKVALYRITQEALNNVVKYAHAHHLTVSLVHDAAWVELSINDDGQGFDADDPSSGTGFGLKIMRERAEAIGAALCIASKSGQGTTVTVAWPVPSSEANKTNDYD
jgi:two-component system nitrate/nitrite sensor histidine kinase NarX